VASGYGRGDPTSHWRSFGSIWIFEAKRKARRAAGAPAPEARRGRCPGFGSRISAAWCSMLGLPPSLFGCLGRAGEAPTTTDEEAEPPNQDPNRPDAPTRRPAKPPARIWEYSWRKSGPSANLLKVSQARSRARPPRVRPSARGNSGGRDVRGKGRPGRSGRGGRLSSSWSFLGADLCAATSNQTREEGGKAGGWNEAQRDGEDGEGSGTGGAGRRDGKGTAPGKANPDPPAGRRHQRQARKQ
jgi:hypothetical protein